jgi:hypothetical protein
MPSTIGTATLTLVASFPPTYFLEKPIGNHGWLSVAWSVGILLVAMPLAAWLFRRRTSS